MHYLRCVIAMMYYGDECYDTKTTNNEKTAKAQKEYIEVAIKDANDSDNTNADTVMKSNTINGGSAAKMIDFES